MTIIGLDDKEYSISLAKYSKGRARCSSYHQKARNLLKSLLGNINVFEEVPLLGSGHPPLIIDFFIPDISLLVETQGQQHYKLNSMFHTDTLDFKKGQLRDRIKQVWAEINGFTLIELPFNEDEEQWSQRLKLAFRKPK